MDCRDAFHADIGAMDQKAEFELDILSHQFSTNNFLRCTLAVLI